MAVPAMNVFTYWEGPRSPFIDVCLKSMARVCGDSFHLVTPENLNEWVPKGTIHPSYLDLEKVELRSDCIRAALLAEHGGWWWDADTIGMRHPGELVEQDYPWATAIYTIWNRYPRRVLNGYIYMTRKVAREWLDGINHALKSQFSSIDWCTMGEGILTPMMNVSPARVEIPRETLLPIDIDSTPEAFFVDGDPMAFADEQTVSYGMNHSYFMHRHPQEMAPPWDKRLLIHRLLRWAEKSE